MNISVQISDDIYREAEAAARRRGVTLQVIVEDALERALVPGGSEPARGRVDFPLIHSQKPGTLTEEQLQILREADLQQEDLERGQLM